MVPLDGSEVAECVLPHVIAVSSGCEIGEVTLIRICEPLHLFGGIESRFSPEERQRLEDDDKKLSGEYLEQVTQRLKESGIIAETVVLQGNIIDKLIDYEANNDVDLTVIATHGRSGVKRMVMGSVADRFLHSSNVPVLIVRAPGLQKVSSNE
jgi:nucleotide-binding universal stress UspA family protein